MRVIVVGAGIMGLSTAWALVRGGHDVHVFEQGPVPNPLGASVDQHRLIRHAYGASRGYTLMVDQAFRAWDRMWADLGMRLYAETGVLVLSNKAQGDWVERSAATLRDLGRDVPWLTADEVGRRFPLLSPDGIRSAFLLPAGGVLFAGRIVEALARHLEGRGVRIRAMTRVAGVDPDRARVVLADGRVEDADALVVAAGAWVDRLLPAMGARVKPSRQVVAYLDPPAGFADAWTRMPAILEIDPAEGFYLVPPVGGTGLKIGDHRFSLTGDPDQGREAAPDETAAVAVLAGRRIRDFDRYRPAAGKVCFYTAQPNEEFVVEPIGPNAWVMSPCSGHGFKFGAVVGEAMAAALSNPAAAAGIGDWAAGRVEGPLVEAVRPPA